MRQGQHCNGLRPGELTPACGSAHARDGRGCSLNEAANATRTAKGCALKNNLVWMKRKKALGSDSINHQQCIKHIYIVAGITTQSWPIGSKRERKPTQRFRIPSPGIALIRFLWRFPSWAEWKVPLLPTWYSTYCTRSYSSSSTINTRWTCTFVYLRARTVWYSMTKTVRFCRRLWKLHTPYVVRAIEAPGKAQLGNICSEEKIDVRLMTMGTRCCKVFFPNYF